MDWKTQRKARCMMMMMMCLDIVSQDCFGAGSSGQADKAVYII